MDISVAIKVLTDILATEGDLPLVATQNKGTLGDVEKFTVNNLSIHNATKLQLPYFNFVSIE